MKYVTINGKEYQIPKMDFDAICDLEERGVDLLGASSTNGRLASTVRGLTAWIMGTDNKTAGAEIGEHLKAGGTLADIFNAISDALEDSGFLSQGDQGRQKVASYQKSHRKPKNHRRNTAPSRTS